MDGERKRRTELILDAGETQLSLPIREHPQIVTVMYGAGFVISLMALTLPISLFSLHPKS